MRIHKEPEIEFVKIYEIITNFSLDGVSNSVLAYKDTLKLLKQYGLLKRKKYYYETIKSTLVMHIKSF